MNSLCYVTPVSTPNFLRCFCNIIIDCAKTCNCHDCSKLLVSNDQMNNFFFYQGFLHRHWQFTGQKGKGGEHLLFHSTTSTRSRTLRHLFETLHVRWLSRIFNRKACVYQTATRFPVRVRTMQGESWNV